MKELKQLGWDDHFEESFKPFRDRGLQPGRIAIENRDNYIVMTADGEMTGEVTGKFLYSMADSADLPKVGDWVAALFFQDERKLIIHDVLPRKSKFSRKAPGPGVREQIVAANLDMVFIVQGLDDNFNLRRLERYLVMVYEGGISPVVLLNKKDLCDNWAEKVAAAQDIAPGVPVLALSGLQDAGLEQITAMLKPRQTYAFIGSSGVGKSTIINRLTGTGELKTAAVRDSDSRGRHTTTRREMLILNNGSLLIDTPGMRELQLWSAESGLGEAYTEISELGKDCHYDDCTHLHEKGCAVLAALAAGDLSDERYQSYVKLRKEEAYLESQLDERAYLEKKRKDKVNHKMYRRIQEANRKRKGN